eukprot:m.170240 g.170240  ORF g.170240 m.170240 type:complete len:90 (-) comp31605_c3_seq1:519-788(-)
MIMIMIRSKMITISTCTPAVAVVVDVGEDQPTPKGFVDLGASDLPNLSDPVNTAGVVGGDGGSSFDDRSRRSSLVGERHPYLVVAFADG